MVVLKAVEPPNGDLVVDELPRAESTWGSEQPAGRRRPRR